MPRIKVIDYEESSGRLREIYTELIEKRGKLAEVHKIQSLRPESITAHMQLYLEIMYSRSELSRAERELIGTVVSMANGCSYCTQHHAQALNHYWKDAARIEKLIHGDQEGLFSEREQALVTFATHLTATPGDHETRNHTPELRKQALSDAAILDVTLVTAYFNFVNRMVLALGVELESDQGRGYRY